MKMNLIAISNLMAGIIVIAASLPLIRRKIKMNSSYGIKIPAAYESEQRWFDINAYGGRLFLYWGVMIVVVGLAGLIIPLHQWIVYSWSSAVIILGGLLVVVIAINQYAGRTKRK